MIRKGLNIRFAGESYREQSYAGGLTASAFIRAPELYHRLIHKPCWQYWIANHMVRANISSLDGREHFQFSTRIRRNDGESEKEAILRQFAMCVGMDCPAEYIGHFMWTAGQGLVADCYGGGRVFLCGDAVHLFTPQGGFGMNTGIDDAVNLAWKLAAVVQGWGSPALLNSYEQERRPIAIRNTRAAQALARQIGDVPIAETILEDSPSGQEARQAAGRVLARFTEEFGSIGIQLGARYDHSDIIVSDGRAPPDHYDWYIPTGSPGGRAPNVWLEPGRSIFDVLGEGFTLLAMTDERPDEGAWVAELVKSRKIPLQLVHVPASPARDLYGADYALVRPDLHVAWRGNGEPPRVALWDLFVGGPTLSRE